MPIFTLTLVLMFLLPIEKNLGHELAVAVQNFPARHRSANQRRRPTGLLLSDQAFLRMNLMGPCRMMPISL